MKDVLTKTVKELFNTIGPEDILREKGGVWFLQDKPLNEQEKKALIAEAKFLLHTRLWKVLQMDVKYQACKAMFEDSKTEMDMVAGKMLLYALLCISTRLKSMEKESGIYNK